MVPSSDGHSAERVTYKHTIRTLTKFWNCVRGKVRDSWKRPKLSFIKLAWSLKVAYNFQACASTLEMETLPFQALISNCCDLTESLISPRDNEKQQYLRWLVSNVSFNKSVWFKSNLEDTDDNVPSLAVFEEYLPCWAGRRRQRKVDLTGQNQQ